MNRAGRLTLVAAIAGLLALAVLWWMPEFFTELLLRNNGPSVLPRPATPVAGEWLDDYFVLEPIDARTFAIGEPRYFQGNYSYLILGTGRAILFDAGAGQRDIARVVRRLTGLPVTVIPSHLHFDHLGAAGHFGELALLDAGGLRERTRNSTLTPGRYEHLGFMDGIAAPRLPVDRWIEDGAVIDLGGRKILALATPGHTPTSVSLYDASDRYLFCGDFIYPGELYAFTPGASRAAYLRTTDRLLRTIAPDAVILAAHLDPRAARLEAPRLGVSSLKALRDTLLGIEQGTAISHGWFPRRYAVDATVELATGFPWNNR